MDDKRIYLMYARLSETFEDHLEQVWAPTLQLLHDLKAGKVSLDRLQVFEGGWNVKPEITESPAQADPSLREPEGE